MLIIFYLINDYFLNKKKQTNKVWKRRPMDRRAENRMFEKCQKKREKLRMNARMERRN